MNLRTKALALSLLLAFGATTSVSAISLPTWQSVTSSIKGIPGSVSKGFTTAKDVVFNTQTYKNGWTFVSDRSVDVFNSVSKNRKYVLGGAAIAAVLIPAAVYAYSKYKSNRVSNQNQLALPEVEVIVNN